MQAREDVGQLIVSGQERLQSGDKSGAHTYFIKATELEPWNELAWLWRAGAANDKAEMMFCLRRVLTLNPDNQRAHNGLAWLDSITTGELRVQTFQFQSSPIIGTIKPSADDNGEAASGAGMLPGVALPVSGGSITTSLTPIAPETNHNGNGGTYATEPPVTGNYTGLVQPGPVTPVTGLVFPPDPELVPETDPDDLTASESKGQPVKASVLEDVWPSNEIPESLKVELVPIPPAPANPTKENGVTQVGDELPPALPVEQIQPAVPTAPLAEIVPPVPQGVAKSQQPQIPFADDLFADVQTQTEEQPVKPKLTAGKGAKEDKKPASTVNLITCPRCHTITSILDVRCPKCKYYFFIICKTCQALIDSDTRICPKCGKDPRVPRSSVIQKSDQSTSPHLKSAPHHTRSLKSPLAFLSILLLLAIAIPVTLNAWHITLPIDAPLTQSYKTTGGLGLTYPTGWARFDEGANSFLVRDLYTTVRLSRLDETGWRRVRYDPVLPRTINDVYTFLKERRDSTGTNDTLGGYPAVREEHQYTSSTIITWYAPRGDTIFILEVTFPESPQNRGFVQSIKESVSLPQR